MAYQAIGPGRVFLGDPTQASGAGMTNLGDHEDVTFAPNIQTGYATSANTGDMPTPESMRTIPSGATLTAGLLDVSIPNLQEVLKEHVELNEADTDSDGTMDVSALVSDPVVRNLTHTTAVFVPEAELAQGAAAPNAVWLPAAFPNNVGDLLQYGRLSEGDNASPFTLELMSVRPPDSMGTTASWFIGDPSALGLTWSLPTSS